jgi:hypothetical protein
MGERPAVTTTTDLAEARKALEQWLRQGDELRQKLVAEQQQLLQRLRAIDVMLRALPIPPPEVRHPGAAAPAGAAAMYVRAQPLKQQQLVPVSAARVPLAHHIRRVLTTIARPVTGAQLFEVLRQMGVSGDIEHVHSVLSRMVKRGVLIAEAGEGESGPRMYRIATDDVVVEGRGPSESG